MVKNHSDSERGNPLPPHGLLVPISSNILLNALSHRQDSTYYRFWYTSCGPLAGTNLLEGAVTTVTINITRIHYLVEQT